MELLRQISGVLAVFGLLALGLWWLRGKGLASFAARPRPGTPVYVESLQRLQLTASHSLHLVRFGDRAVLISITPAGASLVDAQSLASLSAPRPPAPAGGPER